MSENVVEIMVKTDAKYISAALYQSRTRLILLSDLYIVNLIRGSLQTTIKFPKGKQNVHDLASRVVMNETPNAN